MIHFIKDKYLDFYSWWDHLVWKYEEDMFWLVVFLLACLIVYKSQ